MGGFLFGWGQPGEPLQHAILVPLLSPMGNHPLVESVFNLWESGPVTMFVVCCPGALVPADPLSRLSPLQPGAWARAMEAAQERADFLYSRMSVLGLVGSVLI